jgi:iron complex outermembrane receptor protein
VLSGQWRLNDTLDSQLTLSHFRPRDANQGQFSGTTALAEHFSGYTVVDLAGTWRTTQGDWSLGVENLLNRQYFTYYGQANYSGTDDDYYAGRGRTVTLAWKRRF